MDDDLDARFGGDLDADLARDGAQLLVRLFGGLPEEVTLITVGQEFVAVGQAVRPIDEQSIDQATGAGGSS